MEYTVMLTHQPDQQWRADALAVPNCTAEGATHDEALRRIAECVRETVTHSELVKIRVPDAPLVSDSPVLDASGVPWPGFGAFKDDPTWATLFEEIETERVSVTVPQRGTIDLLPCHEIRPTSSTHLLAPDCQIRRL
jgi:predicted RNase H-like HicB family nuclease